MNQSPYAPPRSQVIGRSEESLKIPRPKRVTFSVGLLWTSFVLGFPQWYFAAARDPRAYYHPIMLFLAVFVISFCALTILFVTLGRNWARIVLAFWVVLEAVSLLLPPEESSALVEQMLAFFGTGLDLVALYLLFSSTSAKWFRRCE